MPRQGSPSPAGRPRLEQRASSSQSASRGSPTTAAGQLSKSHKGSSSKLHKTHAVGHGRHPHARVPSYGKGLHKLSKLGPGDVGDAPGQAKHHTRSASHTPTGSPTSQTSKRNSSQTSLPRTGSKASVKRNASNVSMTKLGNQPKSEKAQMKKNLRKTGTDDAPLKGMGNFSVGDDEQEEDWEEASSSQSPQTTRHSSVGRKTPQLEDPPSPDGPPARSPSNLPHSPPQSPPTNPSVFVNPTKIDSPQKHSKYSQPLDGDEVSHRLLDRSKHNAGPKISNISATVTPNSSIGSPAFSQSQDPNNPKEPSMPADGISRFLPGTGSNSGSATPGSVSHLQYNLAHLNHKGFSSPPRRPASPIESSTAKPDARRVKSAADLTHSRLNQGVPGTSSSPPNAEPPPNAEQSPTKKPAKPTNPPHISPYESARGADPNAGKSLTQLKLDLQRMSTLHDTPSSSHPLMFQNGTVNGIQNLNAGSVEMAARLARQFQQGEMEYKNARRFHPNLLPGNGLSKKAVGKKKSLGQKAKSAAKSLASTPPTSTSAETAASRGRGRVRFEIGRSPKDAEDGNNNEGGEQQQGQMGGMEGMLRRMWHQGMDAVLNEE